MRVAVRLLGDESAATAVEYAVMLALVLMSIIATIGTVGSQTGGMWGGIVDRLRDAGFFGPPGP